MGCRCKIHITRRLETGVRCLKLAYSLTQARHIRLVSIPKRRFEGGA